MFWHINTSSEEYPPDCCCKEVVFTCLRKEYLEAVGLAGTVKHELALLAERTGGIYESEEHDGLPATAAGVTFPFEKWQLSLSIFMALLLIFRM